MSMFTTYATRDSGRLHIAVNQYYQGSVNSYNNCFTQFVMKLLGLAQDVMVAGKSYCLNKKSYSKFLGTATPSLEARGVATNHGFMRTHISAEKAEKRCQKMILALHHEDVDTALEMLGKGADVDRSFIWIENQDPSFKPDIKSHIPSGRAFPKTPVYILTPLMYVAGHASFTTMLTYFGANPDKTGSYFEFERAIASATVATTQESSLHKNLHTRPHSPSQVATTLSVDQVSRQTITHIDTYSNRSTITLSNGNLEHTFLTPQTVTDTWSTTKEVGRTPL